MKKKDFLVAAIVLTVALIGGVIAWQARSAAGYARIYRHGELYRTVSLDHEETVVIRQDNGAENVVLISPDGVRMESANCPHQTCVRQGTLTRENTNTVLTNNWIVCLPNGISVEVVWGDTA